MSIRAMWLIDSRNWMRDTAYVLVNAIRIVQKRKPLIVGETRFFFLIRSININ